MFWGVVVVVLTIGTIAAVIIAAVGVSAKNLARPRTADRLRTGIRPRSAGPRSAGPRSAGPRSAARSSIEPGRRDVSDLDPGEAADIGARLAAIAVNQEPEHSRRMAALLQPLIDRHVPARVVEVAPGLQAARIRFADGTTVLARGDRAGDLGLLAALMRECSTTPSSCIIDARGAVLSFSSPGRRSRLSVLVIGFDQPT